MSVAGPSCVKTLKIQIACRNSVSVSLISEINCTDGLCREKAIENIFLLVLGFRTFSHSLGHKSKSSRRANVFCSLLNNGHQDRHISLVPPCSLRQPKLGFCLKKLNFLRANEAHRSAGKNAQRFHHPPTTTSAAPKLTKTTQIWVVYPYPRRPRP
jgi:hypothetical protein